MHQGWPPFSQALYLLHHAMPPPGVQPQGARLGGDGGFKAECGDALVSAEEVEPWGRLLWHHEQGTLVFCTARVWFPFFLHGLLFSLLLFVVLHEGDHPRRSRQLQCLTSETNQCQVFPSYSLLLPHVPVSRVYRVDHVLLPSPSCPPTFPCAGASESTTAAGSVSSRSGGLSTSRPKRRRRRRRGTPAVRMSPPRRRHLLPIFLPQPPPGMPAFFWVVSLLHIVAPPLLGVISLSLYITLISFRCSVIRMRIRIRRPKKWRRSRSRKRRRSRMSRERES